MAVNSAGRRDRKSGLYPTPGRFNTSRTGSAREELSTETRKTSWGRSVGGRSDRRAWIRPPLIWTSCLTGTAGGSGQVKLRAPRSSPHSYPVPQNAPTAATRTCCWVLQNATNRRFHHIVYAGHLTGRQDRRSVGIANGAKQLAFLAKVFSVCSMCRLLEHFQNI